MKQPLVVVNKSGGAGAEGFLDVKGVDGRPAQDHHHAVQPVHHAARHRRAVQLEGPDAGRDAGARPVRAVGQRRDAVQDRQGLHRRGQGRRRRTSSRWAAPAPSRKTRSSPSAIEKATGAKFTYVPFKGGGDVAVQLVGNHVDSTRQQPDRGGGAVARRRAAAAVRVRRPAHAATRRRSPTTMAWSDIPTCKEAGLDVDYLMLRGIFMPPGVDAGAGRLLRRPASRRCARRRSGRTSWRRAPSTRPS